MNWSEQNTTAAGVTCVAQSTIEQKMKLPSASTSVEPYWKTYSSSNRHIYLIDRHEVTDERLWHSWLLMKDRWRASRASGTLEWKRLTVASSYLDSWRPTNNVETTRCCCLASHNLAWCSPLTCGNEASTSRINEISWTFTALKEFLRSCAFHTSHLAP